MDNQQTQERAKESSLPLDLIDEDQVEDSFKFNLADLPVMLFFWMLIIVVFWQFFTRYVLNDSPGWTEEIARYLLIMVGFIGSITAVRKGSHIFLEFIYRYLPAGLTKGLVMFADATCVIFYAYCAHLSFQVAMRLHQTLVSIPIPKSYIYWTIGVCFILMACHSLLWLIKHCRQSSDELVSHINDQIVPD
jgi:TRAP-type C4-dicarboxylate transport system permease small subunit